MAVCEYGAGNVRSVVIGFRRLGVDVYPTEAPEELLAADLAVLPGVGSAKSAMNGLKQRGLDEALAGRFRARNPIIGICLGLQLAVEESEEDGGVECLGLLPGKATQLRAERVPRIGWAAVDALGSAFYFAHSFAVETPTATAFSEGIVAEARDGSFVGVQFHPEKSGAAGARYLEQCLSLG